MFSCSDDYLAEYDERKYLQRREELIAAGKDPAAAKPGRSLARKRQLDKYNEYKKEVGKWADNSEFTMPLSCFHVKFYIPMPASWRKPKRLAMVGQPHQSTPDSDNLLKALFDGLMPRRNRSGGGTGADDRRIWCYSLFKFWCEYDDMGIEIVEYEQSEYMDLFGGNSRKPAELPAQVEENRG